MHVTLVKTLYKENQILKPLSYNVHRVVSLALSGLTGLLYRGLLIQKSNGSIECILELGIS